VWGPDRQVRDAFAPGTWKFVFPQFEIKGIADPSPLHGEGPIYSVIFLGNLEDPRTMSKQSSLICRCCAEQLLQVEETQKHKHE
jgi:hypothetical protein